MVKDIPILTHYGYLQKDILFCKDGHLRFNMGNKFYVPLTSVQTKLEESHFEFLFTCGNCKVVFEDGTTIKSFLSCLAPWADALDVLTKKEISSYIKRCDEPTTPYDNSGEYFVINSVNQHEKGFDFMDDEDIVTYHNTIQFRGIGFQQIIVSMWVLPFKDIANMPLILNNTETHIIRGKFNNDSDAKKIKLHPFLKSNLNKSEQSYNTYNTYWTTQKEYTFKEVIFKILSEFSRLPIPYQQSRPTKEEEFRNLITDFDDSRYDAPVSEDSDETSVNLSRADYYLIDINNRIQTNVPDKTGKLEVQNIPSNVYIF